MYAQNRAARVGDRVRVEGGPYDGRSGWVQLIRGQDDVLFETGKRPIHGLLNEDMALVKFADERGDGNDEVGVPVRRLQIL